MEVGLGFVNNQRPKITSFLILLLWRGIYPSLHTDGSWMLVGSPERGGGEGRDIKARN